MNYRRWIALLLAAAMSLSLLCGGAWGTQIQNSSEPETNSACALEEPREDTSLEDAGEPEEAAPTEDAGEPEEAAPTEDAGEPEETASLEDAGEPEDSASEEDGEDDPEQPSEETADEHQEAEETDEEEGVLGGVNPAYEDLVTQEELERDLAEAGSEELSVQAAGKTYTKRKDAGTQLRKQMKQRRKTLTVTYKTKEYSADSVVNALVKEAMKHTGKGTEGDYLYGQWDRWTCNYKRKYAKGKYTYQLSIKVHFFTSASQEKKTDAAVKKILTQLDLKNDSKFIKFHKIYNYLCDNVKYDHAGAGNSKNIICHSAYAAAVKKKAVCQGYAVLLYRLLLESGVPCRYITGYGGGYRPGNEHAWNIVKLGGKYYNVDSTWDAELRQGGRYFEYFLRSDANFSDHFRGSEYRTTAFYKSYPMSDSDGEYHFWESEYKVDTPATCAEEGTQSIHCMDCGATKDEQVIPATGEHSWRYLEYYGCWWCSVCGAIVYADEEQSGNLYASGGTIQAKNITRSWSAKKQSFPLKASSRGGKLSYSSDQKAVQVSKKGRVTVRAGFAGKAVITIRAKAGKGLPAAERTVTVTVQPKRAVLCRVCACGDGALKVRWKKDSAADGCEVQYSTDRRFKRGVKRVKAEQGSSVTLTGLKKGKRVYVRVRTLAKGAKSRWSEKKSAKVK